MRLRNLIWIVRSGMNHINKYQEKLAEEARNAKHQADNQRVNAVFYAKKTMLLGDRSPREAQQDLLDGHKTQFSRKNRFHIKAESKVPGFELLNKMAVDLDYAPATIEHESRRIGAGNSSVIQGRTAMEVRITCIDNEAGQLKAWFDLLCEAECAQDGTVGVPEEYAVKLNIQHGYAKEKKQEYFSVSGWFKAVSFETQLSRREGALEECTVTFQQIDSFMPVTS